MEEQINDVVDGVNEDAGVKTEFNLPTKVSIWTKIKNFLFQDVRS